MDIKDLYNYAESLKGKEIANEDMRTKVAEILIDIKDNDPRLYSRLRSLLTDYKSRLAERIYDNRQTTMDLFAENEEELLTDNTEQS